MTYAVFDCTTLLGVSWRTRSWTLAHLAAIVLTKLTGRFHDWDAASRAEA